MVEVLGASARLFKPWLLLSSEKVDIFDLLEECSTVWSSLGLEDALHCLCDPFGFEYDGTVHALLASIKYVHDLDVLSLQNLVFTQQKPTCQMSLLTPEMVPGKWFSGESFKLRPDKKNNHPFHLFQHSALAADLWPEIIPQMMLNSQLDFDSDMNVLPLKS